MAFRYYKLCVGHILKLGNSTRLYVVLGPSDDEEAESDKTVTELQNERLQKELQRKKLAEEGILINCSEDGSDACTWGMGNTTNHTKTIIILLNTQLFVSGTCR